MNLNVNFKWNGWLWIKECFDWINFPFHRKQSHQFNFTTRRNFLHEKSIQSQLIIVAENRISCAVSIQSIEIALIPSILCWHACSALWNFSSFFFFLCFVVRISLFHVLRKLRVFLSCRCAAEGDLSSIAENSLAKKHKHSMYKLISSGRNVNHRNNLQATHLHWIVVQIGVS